MKVYIVWFIDSSYQDQLVDVYLDPTNAEEFIKDLNDPNYWFSEQDVKDA